MAIAQAEATAKAAKINGVAQVKNAELKRQALKIKQENGIEIVRKRNEAEISHLEALADLEIKHERDLAGIESKKFADLMSAIGRETIVEIARAGPEMQA